LRSRWLQEPNRCGSHVGHEAERASESGTETKRALDWASAAFIATTALSFLAVIVLARVLPPRDLRRRRGDRRFLALNELISDLAMKAVAVPVWPRSASCSNCS
jgi:hypothetical protein